MGLATVMEIALTQYGVAEAVAGGGGFRGWIEKQEKYF